MAGQKSKAKNDRFSIISVILIFLFSHNDCSDAISEFYLDDDAVRNSVCGDVLTLNDSLFLKSQIGAGLSGGLNNYKSNQNCGTTVTAENGCQILVQFPFFNLQEKQGDICSDQVQLQGNITKVNHTDQDQGNNSQIEEFWNTTDICTDPGPVVSVSSSLKIRFTSDGSVEGAGFSILITAFRKPPCNETLEFLCDSNRCISRILTCDGTAHCLDETDETKEHASCSTLNEAVGEVSGLGRNVIIGIVVIASGLVCTVVIVIMMYQFMDRDSKSSCRRGTEDEEANRQEIHAMKTVISELAPPKSNKMKKSVTIASENIKEGQEKGVKNKRPGVRKVVPSKIQDDEW